MIRLAGVAFFATVPLKSQRVLEKVGMHFQNITEINGKSLLFYIIDRDDCVQKHL